MMKDEVPLVVVVVPPAGIKRHRSCIYTARWERSVLPPFRMCDIISNSNHALWIVGRLTPPVTS